MKALRYLPLILLLPLSAPAAERSLKIDPSRTFVDVDVSATVDSFTGYLDAYDTKITLDETGKVRDAVLDFKFSDLKTRKPERDEKMIEWLGGGMPTGRFELGNLALAPNGQGQASGRLIFHDVTQRIEFPVNVVRENGDYVITGETTIDYRNWNLKIIRIALLLKVDPMVKIRFKFTGTPVDAVAK